MEGDKMIGRPAHILRQLIAGLCLAGAMQSATPAATSSEELKSDAARGAINLDRALPQAARERVQSGNPLWAIPLGSLAGTRERPIFSPSRRPPAPAAVNVPISVPVVSAMPPPPPPASLELSLIGTVRGGSDSIAVFVDRASQNFVRLRTGANHMGWVLKSVENNSVTLQKDNRLETLAFPKPGDTAQRSPSNEAARSNPAATRNQLQRPGSYNPSSSKEPGYGN
ncbi:MAG: general secretion pathway protein GspN [Rhizobiales bacterium]|nr:general secretion pathway protein GspN [Hyphomicrobiales bacterium]